MFVRSTTRLSRAHGEERKSPFLFFPVREQLTGDLQCFFEKMHF
jgi:hypothetical protein